MWGWDGVCGNCCGTWAKEEEERAERDDREGRRSGLGVFIHVRSLKLACGMPV